MAAAYAARGLKLAIRVVVPETTSSFVRGRLEALGAEVEVHGSAWDEADRRARELSEAADTAYVPPFDHPDIWAGHATVIHECAEHMDAPDEVVVAVGGGGLLTGVLTGMYAVGWTDVPVVAVETEGAASLAAAVAAGKLVELPAIESIATTLGARCVAAAALDWTRRHAVIPVQVSDAAAVAACLAFADAQRALVEPACGAALAADRARRRPGRSALVIVCGGGGVNLAQLDAWRRKFGLETKARED